MTPVQLRFDERVTFGSVEHFYHFMWGYLLPSIYVVTGLEQARGTRAAGLQCVLRSCGPLMNPLILEAFASLRLGCEIIDKAEAAAWSGDTLEVPRWDIWIEMNWDFLPDGSVRPRDHRAVIEPIRSVRARLLEALGQPAVAEPPAQGAPLLLLRRAAQPAYYDAGGHAEVAGYGTGRRELHGVDQACDALNARGIPCRSFEPGRHTLMQQVAAYLRCSGVVGIRGAEIANLIWLAPRSRVIVLTPSAVMHPRPPGRVLAQLFDLDYHEIETGSDLHPVLDVQRVTELLSRGGP